MRLDGRGWGWLECVGTCDVCLLEAGKNNDPYYADEDDDGLGLATDQRAVAV